MGQTLNAVVHKKVYKRVGGDKGLFMEVVKQACSSSLGRIFDWLREWKCFSQGELHGCNENGETSVVWVRHREETPKTG